MASSSLLGCKNEQEDDRAAKPVASRLTPSQQRGEKIYKQYCIQCHMLNGKGAAGAFPP